MCAHSCINRGALKPSWMQMKSDAVGMYGRRRAAKPTVAGVREISPVVGLLFKAVGGQKWRW